jgi:hypothetical protein
LRRSCKQIDPLRFARTNHSWVADYYATSVFDGFDFANLLIKTREGRPIKVDNNTVAGAKFAANASSCVYIVIV